MADDVKLLAVIDANTKAFENALKRIERLTTQSFAKSDSSIRRIETSLGRASSAANRFARNFGLAFTAAGAIALASSAIRKFLQETAESEASVAQLNAALKSTGGIAGATSKELQDLAASLANVTVFEDDAIIGVESLLLAFRKIGRDVLPGATAAVLDISTRLKIDLASAAKLVGKAFEDPVKGVNALRKAGIILSPALVTIITNLEKTGQHVKAENLLLRELETRYGGAAVAARETLGGALTALSVAWGELFEVSGPASSRLRVAVENLIASISKPEFKEAVNTIGVDLVKALTTLADIAPGFISRVGGMAQGIIDLGHNARTAVDNVSDFRNKIREMLHLPAAKGDIADIGIFDIDKQIDQAHKLASELKPNLELVTAIQKKLSIAPGGTLPFSAGDNAGIDDTAASEEELADQINRELAAQKEAARERKRAAAELKRQRKEVTDLISDLKFENKLLGLSNDDREVEIALRRAGAAATGEQKQQIADLVRIGIGERELIERMDELRDASIGALDAFAQSIQNGEGAAAGLKAALLDVLQTIIRIGEQQSITSLFGGQGQTGGGLFGNIIGGLFGKATGSGGPTLGSLTAASASVTGGGRRAPVIQLNVVPGQMFEPVVERISGNVSIRHAASAETRAVARTPASARDNQRRFAIP